MSHFHEHPFGSARFASDIEIRRAFRKKGGVPFGYHRGRRLDHSKGAGVLVIGGAGSEKFVSVLSHSMRAQGRKHEPARFAWLSPKGEEAAVLGPGLIHQGAHVFYVNPYNLHGLPNHRVDLFSHFSASSPSLVADCRRAARNWIVQSGGGDSRFFEQTGQNWLSKIIRGLVHADGHVSPLSIAETIGMIQAAPEAWDEMADSIAALGEPDLRITFGEMREMRENSPRTYQSVMSELTNAFAVMADPALQNTFTGAAQADFSLGVLTEQSDRPVYVFLLMPDELIAQNAAIIRQFFSTLRTLKQREPHAPTVNLVCDEAARLGKFKEIEEWYAIGRGFGLSPLCVYQDLGQIRENLGVNGAATLTANAELELYLGGGISDLETAQHLSRKLGNQTLHLADPLTRERAARAKREAVHDMLFSGADPMKTGIALRGLEYEMRHVRKQARALLTPDEILTMPRDQMLVLGSGYDVRPFLLPKSRYFERRDYAGRYFPNPFFDRDMGSVRVRTRLGFRRRRVIREAVPDRFKDFPQYAHGEWTFIEGYRPKLK
ncbi:MAG: hypothetical protein CMM86_13440 [Rhodovulum sp.]|nr:hypothetical protein [Rhodovulum sp.]|tara:strand:- start:1113 stop:2759 length:1647 start_codon:yes stop_codon:yes gene_type:complete